MSSINNNSKLNVDDVMDEIAKKLKNLEGQSLWMYKLHEKYIIIILYKYEKIKEMVTPQLLLLIQCLIYFPP